MTGVHCSTKPQSALLGEHLYYFKRPNKTNYNMTTLGSKQGFMLFDPSPPGNAASQRETKKQNQQAHVGSVSIFLHQYNKSLDIIFQHFSELILTHSRLGRD